MQGFCGLLRRKFPRFGARRIYFEFWLLFLLSQRHYQATLVVLFSVMLGWMLFRKFSYHYGTAYCLLVPRYL